MKTKVLLIVLASALLTLQANAAQNNQQEAINRLEQSIRQVQNENSRLRQEQASLRSKSDEQSRSISSLEAKAKEQSRSIDSLQKAVTEGQQALQQAKDQLGGRIDTASSQIQTKAESRVVDNLSLWGALIAGILLLGSIALFWMHQRRGKDVSQLREKADKINEDIVAKLSSETSEMQTLSKNIGALVNAQTNANGSSEHDLIKALADRITFMDVTLFRMDPSVRGHRHLTKSIRQMKDNLLANGYEIVEMLGKPYNEGMRVQANFTEDESLPLGTQTITNVIKPQINYKGKMIQAAQITVSQNI